LNAIRIYSLHQKRFSEYTLINPMITGFNHDSHGASDNRPMQHTMTVDYSSVLYATGDVNKNTVIGFGDLHYDQSPSPLTPQGGGVTSIFGPGGFVNAIDTILAESGATGNQGTSARGVGAAAFTAFRAFQNAKTNNVNFKGLAEAELKQAVKNVLSGQDLRNTMFIPTSNAEEFRDAQTQIEIDNPNAKASQSGVSNLNNITSNGSGIFSKLGNTAKSLGAPVSGIPEIGSGVNFIGTTTDSGQIGGTSINTVTNLTKTLSGGSGLTNQFNVRKVEGTSQSIMPTSSGFFGAIKEKGQGLVDGAKSLFSQSTRETTGSNKFSPIPTPVPTFVTGTNRLVGGTDPFVNTPFNNMVIRSAGTNATQQQQAITDLASKEGQKFVTTGNKTDLVFGQRVATSTNPAPKQS